MDRTDLEQLSKEQLIELVLQLQRPDKTSRTSSKPPSTDKKEKRENSRPGGAKLGYDLYYVKNFSILFDLLILLQTLRVVLLPGAAGAR